jgi:hypothetical protein
MYQYPPDGRYWIFSSPELRDGDEMRICVDRLFWDFIAILSSTGILLWLCRNTKECSETHQT